MMVLLTVYRNGVGEVFFRVSETVGRTAAYRVQAESGRHLERWLAENGFRFMSSGAEGHVG